RQLRHLGGRERVLRAELPSVQRRTRCRARGDPLHPRHPDRRVQRPADAPLGGDPMTTTPPPPQAFEKAESTEVDGGAAPGLESAGGARSGKARRMGARAKERLSNPWASGIAIVIAILWTVPTFGLLVTSFRPSADIRDNGWWNAFTNPSFTMQNYVDAMGGSTRMSDYFIN